ncbi:MAG: leucyl aminopeptidase, partial [Rhodocyclaceae bacterium]|nr:leucyl aminopeptidase [Rhodocyclaceae bacterium]
MEFSIKSLAPEKARCDCIVVGVFDSRKLSEPAQRLDKAAGGHLAGILRRGDMEGKAGATLLVHGAPRIAAERVLLVGLGKEAEFGEKAYREAVAATVRTLKGGGSKNVVVTLSELPVAKRSAAWRVRQGALAVNDVLYRPDQLKSKKENGKPGLAAIAFSVA